MWRRPRLGPRVAVVASITAPPRTTRALAPPRRRAARRHRGGNGARSRSRRPPAPARAPRSAPPRAGRPPRGPPAATTRCSRSPRSAARPRTRPRRRAPQSGSPRSPVVRRPTLRCTSWMSAAAMCRTSGSICPAGRAARRPAARLHRHPDPEAAQVLGLQQSEAPRRPPRPSSARWISSLWWPSPAAPSPRGRGSPGPAPSASPGPSAVITRRPCAASQRSAAWAQNASSLQTGAGSPWSPAPVGLVLADQGRQGQFLPSGLKARP